HREGRALSPHVLQRGDQQRGRSVNDARCVEEEACMKLRVHGEWIAIAWATRLLKGGGIALVALLFAACVSDKMVVLRYPSDLKLERVPSARAVTVFRFADRRGDEGDSNPRRVGGGYGGYGNRLFKVYATTPWPDALVEDLVTAFGARGIEA